MASAEDRAKRGVVIMTLEISPEIKDRMAELAKRNDRSLSAEVRRALKFYLDTEGY